MRILRLLKRCLFEHPEMDSKDTIREHFTRLTGFFRNLNYSHEGGPDFKRYWREIHELNHFPVSEGPQQ
ncbi:MAG: hypothetical protein KDI15_05645, partial [Thiothrix sp.]|nr:hypothetical protein [Thiothrix sp.]